MENIKLNNGILMPGIGFGTWKIKDYNQVIDVVKNAIEVGYRHIDCIWRKNGALVAHHRCICSGQSVYQIF